ncbi:T9SS type A sorting domain-containing protein [Ekhidna sp.]
MKIRYLLSLLTTVLFHFTEANAQTVNIPDAQFKAALLTHTPTIDSNSDGEIQLTEAESYTYTMNVNNKGITDLTGIEAFPNISRLEARQNNISSVNLSQNPLLKNLSLGNNQLTSIDLSENLLLEYVWMNGNQLSSLDFSAHTFLTDVNLLSNNLETLDVSNSPNLTDLVLANNSIQEIDLSNNILLQQLYLNENFISQLSLASQSELEILVLYDNQLTQIDLANNTALRSLDLSENPVFGHLDLSAHTSIDYLKVNDTQLETLNIANGNNMNVNYFSANNNDSLECIQVDDVAYATSNFTVVDSHVSFSLDCRPIIEVDRQLYDCVDLGTVATATLTDVSFIGEVDFTLGDVLLYKTNRGRYGKLLITSNIDGEIALDWVTYNTNGSVYTEGQLDVVQATDLDRGTSQSIPNGNADFVWSRNTFSPTNGALFNVYDGIVEIPDEDFKNVLLNHDPVIDTNGDGEIQLCEAKAFDGFLYADNASIFNLQGIEAFSNIPYLNVSKNTISRANLDWNHALRYLNFSENNMLVLDVSKNTQLINLDCSNNRIFGLNLQKNTALQSLVCSNNQLRSLNLSENDSLYVLVASHNLLTQLDLSLNPLLHTIDGSYNRLESIDLNQNRKLKKVTLNNNQLRFIDFTNQAVLNSLEVSRNEIEKIDLSQNNELLWLSASDNALITILFPTNKRLYEIDLNDNRLRSLDVADFSILEKLNVSENRLETINVTGSLSLKYLNIGSNFLSGSIDLSRHSKLRTIWAAKNNFSEVNIANEANHFIRNPYHFDMRSNRNLFCIEVDDVGYAETVFTNKDSHTSYSTDCNKSKSNISSKIQSDSNSQEKTLENTIAIYPNPTTNVVHIKASEIVSVSLIDINGKVILVDRGMSLKFNIRSFTSGIYILQVNNGTSSTKHKIIKTN